MKQALNTYLDVGQKARLEDIARRRSVSQATVVREAVAEYLRRHAGDGPSVSPETAWERMRRGYYAGTGRKNDHDDIYRV